MADELTYLRWSYANLNRFVQDIGGDSCPAIENYVDRRALNAAYTEDTGNKPPSDYVLA